MEYAKVQGSFLRSAAVKDADMAARGAWITLIGYCSDQENGGRILGCRAWNDRQWLSRADCMLVDVEHLVHAELASWDGQDLDVHGYDRVAEGSYRSLSEANRKRALKQHGREPAAGGSDAGGRPDGAAGSAGGTNGSRRQPNAVPPAVPPAAQRGAAGTEFGCQPTNQPTNQPTIEDAGAAPPPEGAAAAGSLDWTPTEAESKTLAWVNRQGLPWELADGTDLRRAWISALRHLRPAEAEVVRRRMTDDTPQAFLAAIDPALAKERALRARGGRPPERLNDVDAAAERAAQREAAHSASERERQFRAEEVARERGPYLEQAEALLAEIARAEPRRLAMANDVAAAFTTAVERLRAAVAARKVPSFDLMVVRSGWPLVRDRQLPALPAPAAPEPAAARAYAEPADAGDEPPA